MKVIVISLIVAIFGFAIWAYIDQSGQPATGPAPAAARPAAGPAPATGVPDIVERVGEGAVSTGRNETFPEIDPANGWLYFSIYDDSFDQQSIWYSRPAANGGWEAPEPAAFARK